MEVKSRQTDESKRSHLNIPSEHDLINFAKAYMGSYMGIIEKERPEALPPLAKNAPYDIEISALPNGCFCMLFQKSNKENVIVTDRDWDYVEGKVASGIDYIITVYAHEGATVADAIKKGKKDAQNDIKAMESNEIVLASLHLEKIVDELTDIAMTNRVSLKSIASQVSKLAPIKEATRRGVPQSDMMRMVQSMKDYPATPVEVKLNLPDRDLLENLSKELTGAAKLIDRIEEQEKIIEELEERITRGYEDLVSKIDDKIDRGMAMIMAASDKKIDEALLSIDELSSGGAGPDRQKLLDLEMELAKLKDKISSMPTRGTSPLAEKLHEALNEDISEIKEQLGEFRMRIEVIEEYLMKISGVLRKRA
ncbi:MAG TPA: hypothetical protein ENN25_02545 [Euryarchaeota archaeon]|nr:hypothetical protein [Euryarchaeota archaeon]